MRLSFGVARIPSLGIVAAVGTLLLAGCGKSSAPAPTPTPFLSTATPVVTATSTAAAGNTPTTSAAATATSTAAAGSTPTAGAAATATSGNVAQVSFKSDIESIFQAHCAACHISQQLGGLNLGSYAGLVKGGAVVPGAVFKAGDHKGSIIWQIISASGPWPGGNRMPLGGPYLDNATIGKIATWIDQGAKDN